MVAHGRSVHQHKRADPLAAPTDVPGITGGAKTVDTTAAATATNLAFDGAASGSNSQSAPPFGVTFDPTNPTSSSTALPQSTSPPSGPVAASQTTHPISMSTVIGTCVGAFIGASALILLGLWFYRRYLQSLKQRANSRGPLVSRNLRGDEQRRRSRLEPWGKLEDGDDKWEDMYQTKEVDQVAPMEKLTMFKKTPSVRTAYTHKSMHEDPAAFAFPQSFAQFDPNLAQTLTGNQTSMPEPRPFLGRVEVNSTVSWDSVGQDSYLSVRANRVTGGAMSPTLNMAIPTPEATVFEPHRWESAEVVHYGEGHSAEVVDPFQGGERKSVSNPFFNAQDYTARSRSNSVTKSPSSKGKERMIDPFDDMNAQMPKPHFVQHTTTDSTSSIESKEKAMQSLIAALDLSESEVRERLRVASMQPSVISQTSQYSLEEDVTRAFPLPPTLGGGSSRP
ncbi:hypothetical protein B0H34DRAFT_678821 [Crassisporium funariophilum]|nr:hypothetical protein B0H34DRAFT_678821 [Crassisporium funariophilum]